MEYQNIEPLRIKGAGTGTVRFLREDGTWDLPSKLAADATGGTLKLDKLRLNTTAVTTYTLDVNGSAKVGALTVDSITATGNHLLQYSNTNDRVLLGSTTGDYGPSGTTEGGQVHFASPTDTDLNIMYTRTGVTRWSQRIVGSTLEWYNHSTGKSVFLATNTGDVSIGGTSPTARLQIKGSTSDTTAKALVVVDSNNVERFSIRNDGEMRLAAHTFYNNNNAYLSGSWAWSNQVRILNGRVDAGNHGAYGFVSGTYTNSSATDTAIMRNAAGVIEINNGTSGQLGGLLLNKLNIKADGVANVLDYNAASEAFPRLNIDKDGKVTWGTGAAAGDTTLYRISTSTLKTDGTLFVSIGINTPTVTNSSSSNNSRLDLTTGGVEIKTGISTNIAAKVINTVTNASGDLQQWIKGSTVVAKVNSSGQITASGAVFNNTNNITSFGHTIEIYESSSKALTIRSVDGSEWFGVGTTGPGMVTFNQQGGATMAGPGSSNWGARLNLSTGVATTIGQVIRAFTGQTANLQEWQGSTGTILSRIDAAGKFFGTVDDTALSSNVPLKHLSNYFTAAQTFQGATASTKVIYTSVAGDTGVRYTQLADGKQEWGDGTNARDTFLYRSAAGYLTTDGQFVAKRITDGTNTLSVSSATNDLGLYSTRAGYWQRFVTNSGNIQFFTDGSAANGYIGGSALVKFTADGKIHLGNQSTPNTGKVLIGTSAADEAGLIIKNSNTTLTANLQEFYVGAETFPRLAIDKDGKHTWGTGAAAGDTNLYRSSAGRLRTDGQLFVNGAIQSNTGLGDLNYQNYIRTVESGIEIATKTAANAALKIYNLNATPTGNLQEFYSSTETFPRLAIDKDGKHTWGNGAAAGDTTLYRSGMGELRTDNIFKATSVHATFLRGTLANINTGNNSRIEMKDQGTDVMTNIATNVTLKVTNTHTAPTANLLEAVSGTTTVASIDSTGKGTFTGAQINGPVRIDAPATTVQNGLSIGADYPSWMGSNGVYVAGSFYVGNSFVVSSGKPLAFGDSGTQIIGYGSGTAQGLEFRISSSVRGKWFSNGNLTLQDGGTFTDAGYRLDVKGKTRTIVSAAADVANTIVNTNTAPTANLQEFYVGAETFPRLAIDKDGKHTWGTGAAAGDVTLHRIDATTLGTNQNFVVSGANGVFANGLSNRTTGNNAHIKPTNTGTEISTAISTNVAAKSINLVTNATADLHQFIKGTTVVAKVDANGGIEATKFTQNGTQVSLEGHSHDDRYYTESEVDNMFIAQGTNLIWKGTVANFAALATTYPNPVDNWTVVVENASDDPEITVDSEVGSVDYRYDATLTKWINIGNSSVPMATDLVDGKMSKDHYVAVRDLSLNYSAKTHQHTFAELTNKPTTISGFGITDAYTKSEVDTSFTTLNASNLTSGTVADARLSSNVALKNVTNYFNIHQSVLRSTSESVSWAASITGDPHSRWVVNADGKQEWGNGTNARDTFLYRSAAGVLKTDNSLIVGATLRADDIRPGNNSTNAQIYLDQSGPQVKTTASANVALKVINTQAAPTANLQEFYVGAETFPRLAIDKDGKQTWGTGAAAGDTNLYRSTAGMLKTDGELFSAYRITVAGGNAAGFYGPSFNNINAASNASIKPTNTGTEISTAISTNVAAKVINTDANATGNLQEWIKGSTVMAKVDVNGYATFNNIRVWKGLANESSSTGIGENTLLSTTIGNNNTAVGSHALWYVTSGSSNTAVGKSALSKATTGGFNTAIGYESLSNLTSGFNNTAVGINSSKSLTTGTHNTSIGRDAGSSATGSWNTFLGTESGSTITTSSRNVLIGFLAGNGITTGGNNTIIGSVMNLPATLSDTIILGANTTERLRIDNNGTAIFKAGTGAANLQEFYVGTETFPRLVIDKDGKQTWGTGAAAGDTTLYRSVAGELRTDGLFKASWFKGGSLANLGDTGRSLFSTLDDGAQISTSFAANAVLRIKHLNTAPTANLQEFYVGAETFPRLAIDKDGKQTWGTGAAAGDVKLYRWDGGAGGWLKSDNTIMAPNFVGNLQSVNSSQAQVTTSTTGVELKTFISTNVAAKVINTDANATGNLQEWIKGSTVLAKVDAGGLLTATSLTLPNATSQITLNTNGIIKTDATALSISTTSTLPIYILPGASKRVAVNTSTDMGAVFGVKGVGTSNTTKSFRVENLSATAFLDVYDDGLVKASGKIESAQLDAKTSVAADVPLKVANTDAVSTTDLTQWTKGTTVVAAVDSTGKFTGTINDSTVGASQMKQTFLIGVYDIPLTEQTKLSTATNWDTQGNFIGEPFTNTYQGQECYSVDYFFKCITDNIWIRMPRA
jgi:hypothetical protein